MLACTCLRAQTHTNTHRGEGREREKNLLIRTDALLSCEIVLIKCKGKAEFTTYAQKEKNIPSRKSALCKGPEAHLNSAHPGA